jgi:GT2 family glycosyltransferase
MISIALCTRNRPQHCDAWIAHMANVYDSKRHQILIIDQSNVSLNRAWPTHITYVHTPTRGLSLARNLAIQHCTTPYILFTDDDCRPAHDWLIQAHECITRDPAVAVWFGQAWPSGIDYTLHHYTTHAGQITWAMRSDGAVCHALRVDNTPFHTTQPIAILERLGHGNQMLINCAIARHIGGFDPWLGAGAWLHSGEDVDMTLRMLAHGHACAFAPTLQITHDAWVTPVVHARLTQRYGTGMIALHLAHAWRNNQVARDYLYFRLKEALHTTAPTYTAPSVPRWRHIVAILHGIIGGISLIVWRRA